MEKTIGMVELPEHAEALVSIWDENKVNLSVYNIVDAGAAIFMDVAQAKFLVSLLQDAIKEIEEKEQEGTPWYKTKGDK